MVEEGVHVGAEGVVVVLDGGPGGGVGGGRLAVESAEEGLDDVVSQGRDGGDGADGVGGDGVGGDVVAARLGRVPRAVVADRGYWEAGTEAEFGSLGVKKVVIPRKGKLSRARKEVEDAKGFRKLVRWRTGCEGRAAALKRRWGWGRTLMDGLDGATTWCG